MRKIKLLKNFYSVKDLCDITDSEFGKIKARILAMEIKPDIRIDGINHYSESARDRIMGVYEFEKTYSEIIYFERNNKKEKFETLESKANAIDEKETELLASSFEQKAKKP